MPVKVDLHNHTNFSFDGSMTPRDLMAEAALAKIDVLAVTDHGTRLGGLALRELDPPFRVIIGCEIMTARGELIGLFLDNLKDDPPSGMDPVDAAKLIHDAGGLTYLPHPLLDYLPSRMKPDAWERLLPHLDIVEAINARGSQAAHDRAGARWGRHHHKVLGAGSDAHIRAGVGTGYVIMDDFDGPADFLEKLGRGVTVCRRRETPFVSVINLAVGIAIGRKRAKSMLTAHRAGTPLREIWDR